MQLLLKKIIIFLWEETELSDRNNRILQGQKQTQQNMNPRTNDTLYKGK